MTGAEQWFGYAVLAILAGILVWGMAALQATLMASSKAGASAEMMMMAVGGTDTENADDLDDLDLPEGVTPADCNDYEEMLAARAGDVTGVTNEAETKKAPEPD